MDSPFFGAFKLSLLDRISSEILKMEKKGTISEILWILKVNLNFIKNCSKKLSKVNNLHGVFLVNKICMLFKEYSKTITGKLFPQRARQ